MAEKVDGPRDRNGAILKEGDRVYILARIRRITPEHGFYNLIVQLDDEMLVVQKNPSFTVGVSHMNAKAVLRADVQ